MRKKLPKILITGGAGFIGSEFTRLAVRKGYEATVVDNLTYAGDLKRLADIDGKFKFYKADICNRKKIELIFQKTRPDLIFHFAAQTHVDRSIVDATPFIETNIKGTQILLDCAKKYKVCKFIHISTDEVYGEIKKGKFKESDPLRPNSPYAASKAAADLLIKAYIRTYNFPAVIVRPCNNYGPWQYPEKLIPVIIYNALKNRKIPVYAKGLNMREWLYVDDCAQGILKIALKGKIGEVYNLGSSEEKKNIEVAKKILGILGKPENLIRFVKDRPAHDWRYALDSAKVKRLDWRPQVNFERGIRETLAWFRRNLSWVEGKLR